MNISLNSLCNFPGSKSNSKRVGRGIGSGKGKTSGRGVKGQKARSGVSIRWFEGGQTSIVKRLFKVGFKSRNKVIFNVISIDALNDLIDQGLLSAGSIVNNEFLVGYGFFKSYSSKVKLLGSGNLKTKLNFDLDSYSESAKISINNSNSIIIG